MSADDISILMKSPVGADTLDYRNRSGSGHHARRYCGGRLTWLRLRSTDPVDRGDRTAILNSGSMNQSPDPSRLAPDASADLASARPETTRIDESEFTKLRPIRADTEFHGLLFSNKRTTAIPLAIEVGGASIPDRGLATRNRNSYRTRQDCLPGNRLMVVGVTGGHGTATPYGANADLVGG